MAKFKLELDKRVPLKDGRYNLVVRMCDRNDVMYLKIVPMTQEQYTKVFVKEASDKASIDFRSDCEQFRKRCATIHSEMKPFDKTLYRKVVYGKVDLRKCDQVSLKLTDLIDRYIDSRPTIKLPTKDQYRTAVNKFDSLKPGLTILDITPALLMEFEKKILAEDRSPFTIACYMRHIRSLINHFTKVDKIIPSDYEYPFGGYGRYIIRKGKNRKLVMSNEEIRKVIEFNDFQTEEQRYAKDMWVLSYFMNGMNYTDIFRLKWINIHDDLISFTRMKTENTMRNYSNDIVVPVLPKLRELIERVGVHNSPFILGHLQKDFSEKKFRGKKVWQLEKIRNGLKSIDEKLKLSVPLRMKTARDCYSETLRRAGYSADIRDEMMGHSPVNVMASHYDGIIEKERLFEINSCLIGIC